MVDHPSIDTIREIQNDGTGMSSVLSQQKIVSQHFVPFHGQRSMNAGAMEVSLLPSTRSARKCEALGDKVIYVKFSKVV
jgi:hypothetical protein